MKRAFFAFLYYLRCTGRNRLKALKSKLKSPRYVIGLILALAYIYFFFFRQLFHAAESATTSQSHFGHVALTFFYALNYYTAWIFGPFGRGVIFRQSEIQQLFSAPLLRRDLLLFKFMQAQGPLVITGLIFGALANKYASHSYPVVVFSLYLVGNLAHVHGVLVHLIVKKIKGEGGVRTILALIPGLSLLGAIVLGAWRGMQIVNTDGSRPSFTQVMESPLLAAVIRPLTIQADYILSVGGLNFVLASVGIVGIIGLFAAIVVRFDQRFEDNAIKVAAAIATVKKDGLGGLRKKEKLIVKGSSKSFPRLATTGPVWRAIVWKNVVSIGRLQKKAFRILMFVLMIAFFVASAIGDEVADAKVGAILGFVSLGIAAYASLLGPALLRVDLRIDIPHFDVLKSLPIRGRELLLGEVMGPALVIAAAQWCLSLVGVLALPAEIGDETISFEMRAAIMATAVPGFFAIAFALFSLENLFALYLPSFARLGRGMKAGFDQFGQNLMGAIIRALAVVIMVIPAGLIGALLVWIQVSALGWPNLLVVPLTTWLCAFLIVGECYLLLGMAEERYENFDLSAESLTVET